MDERITMTRAGLLARKGEARPAMNPDNDNGRETKRAAEPAVLSAAMALAEGRRAAFTLRLDPDRHMRLRIACALGGRSAQAIVSEALDSYLRTIPGIDRLLAAAMTEGGDQTATGRGQDR